MEFCDTKHHDVSDKPFRVEYVASTGFVIVDRFGHESVLGYQSKTQAEFAAECMTNGYKCVESELAAARAENQVLREAFRSILNPWNRDEISMSEVIDKARQALKLGEGGAENG